jgi:RimJ/RimL family protein N-acetyltransferase
MVMSKPTVRTDLLSDELVHLTPIAAGDIEVIRTWRNRDDIRVWFNDSRPIERQQQQAWFQAYLDDPHDLMFLIRCSAGMEAVGAVALYRIDSQAKRAEFGRLIIGEGRGRGLGYAATVRACRVAFDGLGVETLELEVKPGNSAARRIYETIGFEPIAGSEQGLVRMQLLRPRFISQCEATPNRT